MTRETMDSREAFSEAEEAAYFWAQGDQYREETQNDDRAAA